MVGDRCVPTWKASMCAIFNTMCHPFQDSEERWGILSRRLRTAPGIYHPCGILKGGTSCILLNKTPDSRSEARWNGTIFDRAPFQAQGVIVRTGYILWTLICLIPQRFMDHCSRLGNKSGQYVRPQCCVIPSGIRRRGGTFFRGAYALRQVYIIPLGF